MKIVESFEKEGFTKHLDFLYSTVKDRIAVISHNRTFLSWCALNSDMEEHLQQIQQNPLELLSNVLQKEPNKLYEFGDYLKKDKGLKYGTMSHYFNSLNVSKSFLEIKNIANSCGNMVGSTLAIKQIIKRFKKLESKQSALADLDITTMIEKRQLPQGGIQDLDKYVERAASKHLNYKRQHYLFNPKLFSEFTGLFIATMYTKSVQGRIGGVSNLQMCDVSALLTYGYKLTNKFKTSTQYTFQPISLDKKWGVKLLEHYVNVVRPSIQHEVEGQNSAFWVDKTGKKLTAATLGNVCMHVCMYLCMMCVHVYIYIYMYVCMLV